ncbi:MAG: LTA synthase family protein [Endomicrobium sp.]|nr:LTA synthase family protein [Endomicrobium sp.]
MTVTIILFIISLFYFSFKIINKHFFPPCKKIIFNIATISLLSVALVIAVRGGIQNRILSIGDAYKYSRITGELKLNGVFTSLISIRTKTSPNKINISFDDALKIVQENVIVNNEEIIVDSNYPLMRKRIKFNVNGKNYNIVIILLESWQKDYIDSLAGTNYGVTPNFDALVKESIVYNRFYANGQRSIMALTSVFFSFPYVKGLTYAGYGLENYGQTKLPLILAKNGYDNVYVQGDKRESDNAIAFAYFLGFKEAYGKQDIPLKYNYLPISKGYDIEGLNFFLNKINSLKNPFIAFYFTTTTHIPYERTILKSMEKYPEDGTKITGYLNRLYYSDYALGKFINKAKQEKWFKNTVFILCADHQAYGVGGITGNFEKTKADKLFKIPAIIYCPALFNPQKTDKLSSQLDIIPTIIDILNIKTPYSSLGKSLFSKEPNRFVFLSCEGEQVYFINSDKVTQQDWQNPADVENKNDKNLLLATEKVVYNLIMHDKWFNNKVILN